jgi:hypothetical protein
MALRAAAGVTHQMMKVSQGLDELNVAAYVPTQDNVASEVSKHGYVHICRPSVLSNGAVAIHKA